MIVGDYTPFSRPACGPRSPGQGRPVAVVTGIGLLTPLGHTADATWDALLSNQFIRDHSLAAGESDRPGDGTPRVIRMARAAATQAIVQAGWMDERDDVPVIVGTSKGSVESWLTPLQHMADSPCIAGGLNVAGLADIAADLAQLHALRLTLSGACASGLMALIRGAMLIESGQARRVLVVAAEASVHPLFVHSFQRLGVLAPPGVGCKPFDRDRAGFVMSEAAAAVCLEASPAGQPGAPAPVVPVGLADSSRSPGVVIDRYALAADGHHLTAGDADGRVLRHLINRVVDRRPVDLIHAHGTGTVTNDPIELAAFEAVIGETEMAAPCLYSHKGALGHSLGAAGLVAVVLNALAHQRGQVPPNIGTSNPLPTTRMTIDANARRRPVHRSLALASGFGGAMAALTLKTR